MFEKCRHITLKILISVNRWYDQNVPRSYHDIIWRSIRVEFFLSFYSNFGFGYFQITIVALKMYKCSKIDLLLTPSRVHTDSVIMRVSTCYCTYDFFKFTFRKRVLTDPITSYHSLLTTTSNAVETIIIALMT